MEFDTEEKNSTTDGVEAIGFWVILGLVLIIISSIIIRIISKWAENRYSTDVMGRSERLQQARNSHLASLEKEMEAFKETVAYTEMQKASANIQNTTIQPEHRGVIKRGSKPETLPWKPSVQSRYCSRKKS